MPVSDGMYTNRDEEVRAERDAVVGRVAAQIIAGDWPSAYTTLNQHMRTTHGSWSWRTVVSKIRKRVKPHRDTSLYAKIWWRLIREYGVDTKPGSIDPEALAAKLPFHELWMAAVARMADARQLSVTDDEAAVSRMLGDFAEQWPEGVDFTTAVERFIASSTPDQRDATGGGYFSG